MPPNPRRSPMLRAWWPPLWMGLGLGATGCATSLDMASAFDAARPATTIPYTGVRGSARRFPDYSPIDRSILVTGGTKPKGSGPR